MASLDIFETYFQKADVDRDGRISGAEAVAFFKGANLPQSTLALIWQYANQGQAGFLSKPEFFNALRLVKVAQSGRELTSDVVQKALTEPAVSQIPAPQITFPSAGPMQPNAFRGPSPSPMQPNAFRGPSPSPQVSSVLQPPLQSQVQYQAPQAKVMPPVQQFQVDNFGMNTWTPQRPSTPVSQPAASPMGNVPGVLTVDNAPGGASFQAIPGPLGGNANLSGSVALGGPAQTKLNSEPPTVNSLVPVDFFTEDTFKVTGNELVPSSSSVSSAPLPTTTSMGRDIAALALVPAHVPGQSQSKEVEALPQAMLSTSTQGLAPLQGVSAMWPRMSQLDVQRYTQIFAQVDMDRDGKITGEEARKLFLSWNMPREVLKQIWDLSDQDGDSMLSLREFCTAIYLMERHREGHPLPPVLPVGIIFADIPPQQFQARGGSVIQPPQNVPPALQISDAQQLPSQPQLPKTDDEATQPMQYKSKVPVLEPELLRQLNKDDQENLKSKHRDAEEVDKKVFELDKAIMDATSKIEFYCGKLQEIILHKSRCDNRLAEISERVSADRHQVELLAKKYDDKFRKAGEGDSRLLADEAAFRDIQVQKMELYNAIAQLEKSGKGTPGLQDRVEAIYGNLSELKKSLNLRAKRLGLRAKPSSVLEIPFGWQPGIQEHASEWDGNWGKIDDKGFATIQDMGEPIVVSPSTDKTTDSSVVNTKETVNSDGPEDSGSTAKETTSSSTSDHQVESAVPKADDTISKLENGSQDTVDSERLAKGLSTQSSASSDFWEQQEPWKPIKDNGIPEEKIAAGLKPLQLRPNQGNIEEEIDLFGQIRNRDNKQAGFLDDRSRDSSIPETPLFKDSAPIAFSGFGGNPGGEFNNVGSQGGTFDNSDRARTSFSGVGGGFNTIGTFDNSDLFNDAGPFKATGQTSKNSDWSIF